MLSTFESQMQIPRPIPYAMIIVNMPSLRINSYPKKFGMLQHSLWHSISAGYAADLHIVKRFAHLMGLTAVFPHPEASRYRCPKYFASAYSFHILRGSLLSPHDTLIGLSPFAELLVRRNGPTQQVQAVIPVPDCPYHLVQVRGLCPS